MELHDAARLARAQLNEHGFGAVPFQWTRSARVAGQVQFVPETTSIPAVDQYTGRKYNSVQSVKYVPKYMGLSERWVEVNDEAHVLFVIKHEIAHLQAGAKANHGPIFKAHCRRLGIPATRCIPASLGTTSVEGPWVAKCPGCGKKSYKHRKPTSTKRRSHSCCSKGVYNPAYPVIYVRNIHYRPTRSRV